MVSNPGNEVLHDLSHPRAIYNREDDEQEEYTDDNQPWPPERPIALPLLLSQSFYR